jgi:hypothetical protein
MAKDNVEDDLTNQVVDMFLNNPSVNMKLWRPLRLHLVYYLTCTAIIHLITIAILIVILMKLVRGAKYMGA